MTYYFSFVIESFDRTVMDRHFEIAIAKNYYTGSYD